MQNYAVLDPSGNIVNRIVLDVVADWPLPAGQSIVAEAGSPYAIGGTLIGGVYTAPAVAPAQSPPVPSETILSQDLMAQFTAADAAAIQAAIAGNAQFWLLWSAMQAQKDPMVIANARFLTGWAALTQILGQARMAQIAAALNVTIA
jgi:hypothetical protein